MQTTSNQTKNNKNMRLLRNMRIMMLGAVAALPMWGCIRDGVPGQEVPALAPGMVRINYTIDGMESATRATETASHERLLNDVHILFYDQEGRYVTYQHASVTTGTDSFTFPIPDKLSYGATYKTLIVGNAHSHVPTQFATFDAYLEQSSTMTYDQMRQEIYAERNDDHTSASGQHSDALPMWGEMVGDQGQAIDFQVNKDTESGAVSFTGSVRFSRSVCRIDLRHLAAQKLIIKDVKLCNYRKAGYYFHNDAPLGEIQSGLNEEAWVAVGAPYAGNASTPELLDNQQLNAAIYAFPNIVPVAKQNDDQTTYLMIRGYYQDGTDNTPEHPKAKLTYYRFNLAENGRSQILRRNYRYEAVINSVKGAGADDEQGAQDAEAPMLGYTVDNTWTDDDSNTVTDDKGNYMTISRAMVTFDGYKDLSEAIKVKLKDPESMAWSLEWDMTQGSQDYQKFNFSRVDNQQFSITTLEDNQSDFTNTARLIVKATGGTIAADKPLTATVTVMQFSSKMEAATLMVDGQTGTITQTAPGAGATLSFQVETGSLKSGWMATADNTATAAGVTCTQKGANRGLLEIDVPTNISAGDRDFVITVQRVGANGQPDTTVNPVKINIKQPKSDYLLTVSPTVPMDQEGLVIDGFDPTPNVNPNGISKQQQFTVMLADPENYTWKVESSFDMYHDAVLTADTPAAVTTQTAWYSSHTTSTITDRTNGTSVWLNVFRTGPGDPDIHGTLTFTAVPKSSGSATQSINISVTIKTPCTINDVLIPMGALYLLVADRNVGATQPRISQEGKFVTAGNFSNLSNMHITGKEYSEQTYEQWRGGYYDWKTMMGGSQSRVSETFLRTEFFREGQTLTNYDNEGEFSPWYKEADVTKWEVPSQSYLTSSIIPRVVYSKQRPFVVSDYKDLNGNYVGCFFPLAGSGVSQGTASGYYWSSTYTGYNGGTAYPYTFSQSAASMSGNTLLTTKYSVRCVRMLSKDEVTQAQTDHYIGEKWQ